MDDPAPPDATAPPGPAAGDPRDLRRRLLVTTLIMVTALTALVGTLGAPLIVAVTEEHDVSTATAQWTISLPCLLGAACMPMVSWLASTRHRRRTALVILALMTVGSVVAALGWSFEAVLVGRSLHGLGLGLLPIAVAAARETLTGQRRDRAIATVSVANVLGAGVSFPVVGILLDLGGTSLAYLATGGVTVLTLALAAWVMPAHEGSGPGRPVDVAGTLLLAGGGTGLVLVLTRGEISGWTSPTTIGTAATSVLLVAAWIWHSNRTENPLMDLGRARSPLPLSVFMTSFTGGAGMFMMLTFVMVIAQSPAETQWGLGLSGSSAGLMMLPYAMGTVLGSRLSAGVRRRLRPPMWLPIGCAVYALSSLALLLAHQDIVQLLLAMALAGFASGISFAQMPGLLVLSVPVEETGAAVGFSMVIRLLGFSLGSTMAGVLLSGDAGASATVAEVDLALAVNLGWWLLAVLTAVVVGIRRGPRLPSGSAAGQALA